MEIHQSNKSILSFIFGVNGFYVILTFIVYLIRMRSYPVSATMTDYVSLTPYLTFGIVITLALSVYFYRKYDRLGINVMDKSKVFLISNLPAFIMFDLTIFIIYSIVIEVN
jgi:hypothetical protein